MAFTAGNQGGPGGARPGSGRKPGAVKQALATLLTETPYTVVVGAEGKERTVTIANNLVELAVRTIGKAMTDRDEIGNVTGPGLRAAQDVVDRTYGKARQTLKLQGERRDLAHALQSVHGALTAGRMQDIFRPRVAQTQETHEDHGQSADKPGTAPPTAATTRTPKPRKPGSGGGKSGRVGGRGGRERRDGRGTRR